MTHHKRHHPPDHHPQRPSSPSADAATVKGLEIVVKSDTGDALEAVVASLLTLGHPELPLAIISSGVGDINKNDLLTAATGSRLIIGFNVAVLPHVAEECRRQAIDVRLYMVIYTLLEDMRRLVASLMPTSAEEETVTGNAKVVALFKSCRKGIILGCQVLDGRLRVGDSFRLISAMGPVYAGVIREMHRERDAVNQALPGQQVGIKIPDFNKAKVGDMVECLLPAKPQPVSKPWQPSGTVLTYDSPAPHPPSAHGRPL